MKKVVVAILGILAVVATSNLMRLITTAQTRANEAEKAAIQMALDSMMAANNMSTGLAVGDEVTDWSTYPTGGDSEVLYPKYLRDSTTTIAYDYTTDGTVSVD